MGNNVRKNTKMSELKEQLENVANEEEKLGLEIIKLVHSYEDKLTKINREIEDEIQSVYR